MEEPEPPEVLLAVLPEEEVLLAVLPEEEVLLAVLPEEVELVDEEAEEEGVDVLFSSLMPLR